MFLVFLILKKLNKNGAFVIFRRISEHYLLKIMQQIMFY